jgi:hypothetical protein
MLTCGSPFCEDEGKKNERESVHSAQNQETAGQAERSRTNDDKLSYPFTQKTKRNLKETHGSGEDSFEQPHLTEGKAQFRSNERKKKIDGIGKAVVKKVEGAERKESAKFL